MVIVNIVYAPLNSYAVLQLQDVGCFWDLAYLYEVTTADDVYNAYNYLSLDDTSLFTCMGSKHAYNYLSLDDTSLFTYLGSKCEDMTVVQVVDEANLKGLWL